MGTQPPGYCFELRPRTFTNSPHVESVENAMRVAVTGGSGFIGTNLVEHYLQAGAEGVNIDVRPPRKPAHSLAWKQVDILDRSALSRTLANFTPDVILHMAARTDLQGDRIADYEANIKGVSNLVAALEPLPRPRIVVFASSMLVCRLGYRPRAEDDYCPSTTYGESKVVGEQLVRVIDPVRMPWTILRPTSIWGPWFATPYRDFFEAVARGLYVHPRRRLIQRNYGFVLNSVHQIDRIVSAGGSTLVGRTAYLADYEPIDLKTWADRVQVALNARPVREVPVPLLRIAARLGDAAKYLGLKQPPITSFRLNNMLTDCLVDTAPIRAVAGALPYDQTDAVEVTCEWMLSESGALRR